jgi:hypothetical protein
MSENYLVSALIIVALLALAFVHLRRSQRQLGEFQAGRKMLDDAGLWLHKAIAIEAEVISRAVQISPKAPKIAKVDLELRLQPPGGTAAVRKACWLVEVEALTELEIGKKVSVRFSLRRPDRIFPSVPWARAWVFGEAHR